MSATYQIHFVGLGVFYADSSEAVQALASLYRDDKVKGFVLQMLVKGVIKDKALNNLDFLFSRCKSIYDSDSFYCRVRDVLNWGLKHLIGYAVTVPVEEHFETSCVECYSKEDNYKDALDLLDNWKERQDVEAGEESSIQAEDVNEFEVVDVSDVPEVPAEVLDVQPQNEETPKNVQLKKKRRYKMPKKKQQIQNYLLPKDESPEQRSLNWFRLRLGMFTGSMVYNLMKKNRAGGFSDTALSYIYQIAAERALNPKLVENDDTFFTYLDVERVESKAMCFGTEYEDVARQTYKQVTGNEVEEVSSVRHETIPCFASSPDGIISNGNGCVEIKVPQPKTFMKYRTEIKDQETFKKVKMEYYYQCQAHMMCTGASWCDFVVFNPFMLEPIKVWRILPDLQAQKDLETAIIAANAFIDENLTQKEKGLR